LHSSSIKQKGYFSGNFQKDLMAGLTVGVISLPLAMAFAIASGVKPEYGIYTTVIAALAAALFGGSRFQVTGPTGAFIPILLSIVLTYGYQNLLLAGFMAGTMLVVMGIFKMGSLIKFIPRPVTVGFTSGIAVTIFVGQIPSFLGLTGLEPQEGFLLNVREIFRHIDSANWHSVIVGVVCLAAILITPRLLPKVPGSLMGLLISTVTASVFFPNGVSTIASAYGGIPGNLPEFRIMDITLDQVQQLWRPAFTIAILGAIESLLSAVVADGMTSTRHDSNRELIGQGIANMISPLFGGIPSTGAIARTATNIKSGATTKYSAVISGFFVLVILLILAPYAGSIPLASMAPVLMIVAYNMSEYHSFFAILKTRTYPVGVLVVTFFLTVFANLTTAVEIGLLLATLIILKWMSETMVVDKVLPDAEDFLNKVPDESDGLSSVRECPQICIFSVEGPLFFGAAQMFSQTLMDTIHYYPKVVILRMSKVSLMDLTGEDHLHNVIETLHKRGTMVLVAGLNPQPEKIMKATGLYDLIAAKHFFSHTSYAIAHTIKHIDIEICHKCKKRIFKRCTAENRAAIDK
jgi:SulP family sulfate permease